MDRGATAVITHRVHGDRHADYESWLLEIGARCRAADGHLDWHVVRPIPGLTTTYTFIIRFDTIGNLRRWMESPIRAQLIERVRPLLLDGDDFFIGSGLDFWFAPEGARARIPVRWKQFLVTWSAIYPLVLAVPLVAGPLMRAAGVPDHPLLATLVVTGAVVFLMVYVVMPRYTKLVAPWLFR